MAAVCSRGKVPPKVAEFFHSFPHVNFNFDNISTTFEPTDSDYQQNFLLYSSVPVVIGSILFLIFTLYFLTYCCAWCHKIHKKQISKKKSRSKCAACLALFIWLSSLVCSGSIVAGFVFNDNIACGVNNVTTAITNVSKTFKNIQNGVSGVQTNLLYIQNNIKKMMQSHDIPEEGREILQRIQDVVLSIIDTLSGVKREDTPDVNDYITTGEYYRWWVTFGILGLGILTCLFALYSSFRHSRCGFAMTIFLGCLSFLLSWVLLGSHLGASIAMSDLCVNPRKTIDFYTRRSLPPVQEIVNYYVECKPNSKHPYDQYMNSSLHFVHEAVELLKDLEKGWLPSSDVEKLTREFSKTKTELIGLRKSLQCSRFHQQYQKARCAVCFPVLGGLSKLLLISIILVVFLAVMLLLIIPMCGRIHHRKRRANVNVADTMLNREESMETEYHSVLTDEESLPLMLSVSPPPYNAIARPNDFQFHSCQEERNPSYSSTQPQTNISNNLAPPPPRGEITDNPRKVTTMAF